MLSLDRKGQAGDIPGGLLSFLKRSGTDVHGTPRSVRVHVWHDFFLFFSTTHAFGSQLTIFSG